MSRLPLQTLHAFHAVARLHTLRAAAESLHLTHSAISQQIKLLEEQLGYALFERRGRRVVLNAAGTALYRAVETALGHLDEGMRQASAAAHGAEHRLRLTVPPSFAQRWLLPRMGRWREQHPDIAIDLHTSMQVMDLKREGFHAAVRQGSGHWRGLSVHCLLDSPLTVLGSPATAQRLLGRPGATQGDALIQRLAEEPLLGNAATWERWFAQAGWPLRANPAAAFNDAGMMLQAVEQGLGITLAREVLAADALREGRLARLSPQFLIADDHDTYWLVHPPAHEDWPPLQALLTFIQSELNRSTAELRAGTPTP